MYNKSKYRLNYIVPTTGIDKIYKTLQDTNDKDKWSVLGTKHFIINKLGEKMHLHNKKQSQRKNDYIVN